MKIFRGMEIEQKRGWEEAPYLDSALLIYSMLKGWNMAVLQAPGPRNNTSGGWVKTALELGRGGGTEPRASGVLHPCSGICCLLPWME